MQNLNIDKRISSKIEDFILRLKEIYPKEIVSVILYGSAASGEFVSRNSNLNFLIIFSNLELLSLKPLASLMERFPLFEPLFLSEEYIAKSQDVFPIEFLDMQENYSLLYGKDVLKNIVIDTKNLRFQCEHELKVKLIALRQHYIFSNKNNKALQFFIIKTFISVLHISRNILRLKGIRPPYKKEEIICALTHVADIDTALWNKLLKAKQNVEKLRKDEIESIYKSFISDLQKIISAVDNL
jgi:predicted nucleotidyltransferase